METQTPPMGQPTPPPPASSSKPWIIMSIILAVLVVLGIVWYAVGMKSDNDNQGATGDDTNGSQQSVNPSPVPAATPPAEFPWSQYPGQDDITSSENQTKSVASVVKLAAPDDTMTYVVAKQLDAGGSSQIKKAYIFDTLNLATKGNIEVLYVKSNTTVTIARGATVGQKVVMTNDELVAAAMAAAGVSVAPSPSPTPNPGPTPQPGPTPTPNPSPQPISYVGIWNGTFTASAIPAAAGCQSGALTFTVATDGSFVGYVTVQGTKYAGGGTVTSTGKVTGAWTFSGEKLNMTGQLNASSGSGTYTLGSGCYGTFSVKK